jgi:hypothetical protein
MIASLVAMNRKLNRLDIRHSPKREPAPPTHSALAFTPGHCPLLVKPTMGRTRHSTRTFFIIFLSMRSIVSCEWRARSSLQFAHCKDRGADFARDEATRSRPGFRGESDNLDVRETLNSPPVEPATSGKLIRELRGRRRVSLDGDGIEPRLLGRDIGPRHVID